MTKHNTDSFLKHQAFHYDKHFECQLDYLSKGVGYGAFSKEEAKVLEEFLDEMRETLRKLRTETIVNLKSLTKEPAGAGLRGESLSTSPREKLRPLQEGASK